MSETSNQVEALLFSSGKAMTVEDIANLMNIEKKEVKKALKELKEKYDSADSSLMVMQEGDYWKLNIREKFASLVTKIIADTEMNTAVLETLSVIAWKSPVLQSDVVKIRTSNAYEHIKELVEAGFINKDREGRSYRLKIAEKFFEYFDVPGNKGIKEAFKEVKIPEKKEPEHLGELEVVPIDEESKEEKPEVIIPPIDEEFLDKVHKQIEEVSVRNDELENDDLFKRKQDEDEVEGSADEVSEDSEDFGEEETEEAESESSSEDAEDVREELSEILVDTEDTDDEHTESEQSDKKSEESDEKLNKESDDELENDESTEDLEKLDDELDDDLEKLKEVEEAEDSEESDDELEDEEEKKKDAVS